MRREKVTQLPYRQKVVPLRDTVQYYPALFTMWDCKMKHNTGLAGVNFLTEKIVTWRKSTNSGNYLYLWMDNQNRVRFIRTGASCVEKIKILWNISRNSFG